jgi:hypothetical protein
LVVEPVILETKEPSLVEISGEREEEWGVV